MRLSPQISLISLFLFASLSLGQTATGDEAVIHLKLFNRYQIPQELQKEEIGLFLQRMDWFMTTIQKDDWRAATSHPARFGNYCDWSNVVLTYYFDTDDSTRDYYLDGMQFEQINEEGWISNLRFEGDIRLREDGRLQIYWAPMWRMWFAENNDEDNGFRFSTVIGIHNLDRDNEIRWNNEGVIVYDDYKAHGEDFWNAVFTDTTEGYLEEQQKYFSGLREANEQSNHDALCSPITIGAKDSQVEIKTPKDTEKYEPLLKNCTDFFETLKTGSVSNLQHAALEEKGWHGAKVVFRFKKNVVFDVAVVGAGTLGRYLLFDDDGRVKLWLEGSLEGINTQPTFEKEPVKYKIGNDGIVIKFHSSGYPASYKSLVGNQLDRQIEWDENGNVISDIDPGLSKSLVVDTPQPVVTPEEAMVNPRSDRSMAVHELQPGEELVNDGKTVRKVTETTITVPKIVAIEPYVFPEKPPISRWGIALCVGSFIALLLLAWYLHRKGVFQVLQNDAN